MAKTNTAKSGGLPARWRRNRFVAGLVTIVLVSALLYPLRRQAKADGLLDSFWLAARFTLRNKFSHSAPPDPAVVLVVIDNACLDTWHEPVIAWNRHIARTLDILRISGVRAIGIDRIQPEGTEEWLKKPAGNDEVLLESLSKATNVVWAKEFRAHRWVQPWAPLISAIPGSFDAPDDFVGHADLPQSWGMVTAFEPSYRTDPKEVHFAVRIAERAYHTASQIHDSYWELPGRTRLYLREDNSALIDYKPSVPAPVTDDTVRRDAPDGSRNGMASEIDEPPPVYLHAPFATYSMKEVAALPLQPDARFRDKLVLIGTSFTGDPDKHPTPVFGESGRPKLIPGVEIHANILSNLISGRNVGEPHVIQLWLISVALGACAVTLFLFARWLNAALSVVAIAALWIALSFGVFNVAHYALPITLPLISLAVCGGSMGGYLALSEERQRRQVLGLWGQYQDPRLVSFLMQNEAARGGQGQEMQVTVLFADLKNFTKTVEHLSPTDTIFVLNRYLGMLDSVIRKHGGIVDKYLGDGLMAQWGAPALPGEPALEGHAEAAMRACIEIQEEAQKLAKEERGGAAPVGFELRLTLHTGPVVFGWVGAKRLELTIIGDTVNVTSRLQETAKQMGADFLISESTHSQLREPVSTGKSAEVEIRGRDRPLLVYEIVHTPCAPELIQSADC